MAEELRLRGQETQIRILRNRRLEATLIDILSCTITPKFDILRTPILGETSDRRDDIYRGVAVELTFHPRSIDAFTLVELLIQRAQRRTAQASAVIDLSAAFFLPNGQRPRYTIPDLKTGDIPISIPARDQYVDIKLSLESESIRLAS